MKLGGVKLQKGKWTSIDMFQKIEFQVQKTIGYYKKHGFIQFAKRFFGKLGFEHFSSSLIFRVSDLKEIPDDVKKPYSFHIATIDDIQNKQDHDFEFEYLFTKREIIDRLQKGHRLFVLKENKKMVYFLWIEQKDATIGVWRMPLNIPKDMVYVAGEFTMPEFRNRGIASKLKKEIFHYLKYEGVKKVIGVVNPVNTIAIEVGKKLGRKSYQTITYKRYWHIRHYTVQKFNSDERKTFVTLFKAPKDIWKTYL